MGMALIVLLIICILVLALFSAAETAFFSLSSMQVKAFRKDSDPKKKQIAELLSAPGELLVSLIIVIIVMSLAVQSIVCALLQEKNSWVFNVGIPLGINLILGEIIPKSLALPNNNRVSYKTVSVLVGMQKVLFPVRKFLSWVVGLVTPILFFFLRKEAEISIEELQHALRDSKDRGILLPEETELIRGYLHLQESIVRELMHPREEIAYFSMGDAMDRLVSLFRDHACSSVICVHGGLDQLAGVISSSAFFQNQDRLLQGGDLSSFLTQPYFVPETLRADLLLRQFYEKKETAAIAVNEYGSITGFISLEDLVEEVIGKVAERKDRDTFFTRAEENVIIASGKLELAELEEIFDVTLPNETHRVTVGGWLIAAIGEIPKAGFKYRTKDLLFHILAAEPTHIRRIYIRKLVISKFKKSG